MATFESLTPSPIFLNPDFGSPRNTESPDGAVPAFESLVPSRRPDESGFDFNSIGPVDTDRPLVDDSAGMEQTSAVTTSQDTASGGTPPEDMADPAESVVSPGNPYALHNVGVRFDDGFNRRPNRDFYDVDVPVDRNAANLETQIRYANVFGRKFSRADLEKDDEGRRLLGLMEAARSGKYLEDGFWSGLFSFKDLSGSYKKTIADIPFLGWMVDGGMTIGETIDMSKTMRKMQNGEPVSDHEAIAVRRFMLQNEMESRRGIGYTAGSLVHSSIPFMFEMAMSSAMVAGALKAGFLVGSAIGGPVGSLVGSVIGGVGGLVFGGGGRLLSRLATRFGGRAGAAAAERGLVAAAERAAAETGARRLAGYAAVRKGAAEALGMSEKELMQSARRKAYDKVVADIGREIAAKNPSIGAEAAKKLDGSVAREIFANAATPELRKQAGRRTTVEAYRMVAENADRRFTPPFADSSLATKVLLDGDTEMQIYRGFESYVEKCAIDALGETIPKNSLRWYWAARSAKGRGLRKLIEADSGFLDKAAKDYVKGVIATLHNGVSATPLDLVIESANRALGDGAVLSNGFAKKILDRVINASSRSIMLKYGVGEGAKHGMFLNSMERVGRWFADGAMDGLLRWDTSMFGGIGTIARSGTNLGGKMNVLKEALKVSFVEAPVRGAMQLTAQVPLWPIGAMMSGHGASDFVVKGQLGIQSQALQTGDRDLMEHSRAIAFGSGLVEYISENAGRGFNMLMGGIMKPVVLDVLPAPVKDLGSSLARKVEAVFGSESDMIAKNTEMIADAVTRRMQTLAARKGVAMPMVSRNDLVNFVKARSTSGIASLESAFNSLGVSGGSMIRDAISQTITHNKVKAACLYFTSFYMMKHGLTPQKFADLLQRVGYDGVVSEMAEERYGGFFQGLLGLNERPSDEGFAGRMKAAMEGLFPDKDQLITEAIGFAIPAIAHASFNRAYSALAQGGIAKWRRDVATLNIGMNASTELNLPVDSPEYVSQVNEWRDRRASAFNGRFGTDESNRKAIADKAQSVIERIGNGSLRVGDNNKQLADIHDAGKMEAQLLQYARMAVDNSGNENELDEWIAKYDLANVLGEDGVAAVRNMAAHKDGFTSSALDEFYQSDAWKAVGEAPLPAEAAGAELDDVVNRITMSVPVLASDLSALSDIRRRANAESARTKASAGQYRDNLRDSLCDAAANIGNALLRAERGESLDGNARGFGKFKSMAHRCLARFVGVMDAIVTGDLSLAANNPVMWALADESLDRDFAAEILLRKKASVRTGAERVLSRNRDVVMKLIGSRSKEVRDLVQTIADSEAAAADATNELERDEAEYNAEVARKELSRRIRDFVDSELTDTKLGTGLDADLFEQFIAAGEEDFRERLQPFMSAFMTAKNVLDVSRSDLSEAARKVAVGRAGKAGRSADEVTSDDVETARRDIVQTLVRMASDKMFKVNTSARFSVSNSTSVMVDVERAMAAGTEAEIISAIQSMPAFAYVPSIHNLSGGNLVGEREVEAFGRTIDLADIVDMPDEGDFTVEQLRRISRVLGNGAAALSERELQARARKFVDQAKILLEYNLPSVHRDASGNEVKVTYSRTEEGIVATMWDKSTPAFETGPHRSVSSVVAALRAGGVQPEMRKIVFMKNSRLVSEDAMSVVLTFMTRDQARSYFISMGVEESMLPHYLQYDETSPNYKYDLDEAMNLMRDEMALAGSESDEPAAEEARMRVYGDTETKGYEVIAADLLESMGHRRVTAGSVLSAVGVSGKVWSIAPSSMNFGPVMYVTSDYFSSGDSEAILRSTVRSALFQAFSDGRGCGGNSHSDVADMYYAVSDAFDRAIDTLVSELSANPRMAERLEQLRSSFTDGVPGRIKLDKLAAIVSAVGLMTCDRGVADAGNGFLMSPELALVADRLRGGDYPEIVPFLSLVDKALGGTGAFGSGDSFTALRRLAAAFSPSGDSVLAARATSMFSEDGKAKPPVSVATLSPGEVTAGPDGRNVMESVRPSRVEMYAGSDTPFLGAESVLDAMARSCAELRTKYIDSGCDLGSGELFESDVFGMLVRADAGGGETSGGDRAQVVLGRTAGSKNARRIGPAVVQSVEAEATRSSTSDVISDVDAVSLARNLSFLIPAESEDTRNSDTYDFQDAERRRNAERIDALRSGLRARAMSGGLSEVESRVVASDPVFRENAMRFLTSRGMDTDSIDRVMAMLPVAFASRSAEVDRYGNAVDAADDAEGSEQDELNDAVDKGSNLESYHSRQKEMDAVGNKDLLEIGRTLVHIFPREKRNHMAVFSRMVSDFTRLAGLVREEAESPVEVVSTDGLSGDRLAQAKAFNADAVRRHDLVFNFVRLSDSLNVLRDRGDSDANDSVANADKFDDPKLLEYRVTRAIDYLVSEGHLEYAYILNAMRSIKDGVRRTKAFENVAFFNRLDARASYVNVSDDGDVSVDARPIGSSSTGCEDAIAACISGFANSLPPILDYQTSYKYLKDLHDALVFFNGRRPSRNADDYYTAILKCVQETKGASHTAFDTLVRGLFPAEFGVKMETSDDGKTSGYVAAGIKGTEADVEYVPPAAPSAITIAAAQRFADAFVLRMQAVADAVDVLCEGKGNELAAALRNPEMKVQVLNEIYMTVTRPNNDGLSTSEYVSKQLRNLGSRLGDMYVRSFPTTTKTGLDFKVTHTCQLLEELMYSPVAYAVAFAYRDMDVLSESNPDGEFADIVRGYLANSDLVPVFARGRLKTPKDVTSVNLDEMLTFTVSTGRSWSPYATLFQWMEAGAARSTVRVTGTTSDQFGYSGQAIGCPPSPPVLQSRLEDRLLKILPDVDYFGNPVEGSDASLYDSYMANGLRFNDGSRLVCTSAGAAVGGEIQDGAAVSRIVFQSNVDKYVERGDMRHFLFQLYHGEKPTVNSVQLPGYVCERLYRDILDGVDYARNSVTDAIRSKLADKSLADIEDRTERRLAYDALFSVVAHHAACDEIDSKRVQVLLSQGIPFAGHRDVYTTIETVDGVDTEVEHTWEDVRTGEDGSGDPVVPATRFVIGISGHTATANLGMYFCHGRIVEAQRGISTNPYAVSFKNHLTDWIGAALTKGQGHDIGIGLDDDEEVPMTGVMRHAQAVMRRELERVMGFPEKSLDRLDADTLEKARNGDQEAKEAVERRAELVRRAKEFLKFSSLISTDLETQKSGPFSSRCGFYAESASSPAVIRVAGREFQIKVEKSGASKRTVYSVDGGSSWNPVPEGAAKPSFKNGSWDIACTVALAMRALGIESLSSEEFGAIEAEVMSADGSHARGTIAESGLFHAYGNRDEGGDEVTVFPDGAGGYSINYATRSTIGQIMANADASSTTNNDHPAATNYVRDLVANQAYRMLVDYHESNTSAAAIATVARAIPQCMVLADEKIMRSYLMSNPEFAQKVSGNPLSDSARHQMALKENAAMARMMRVYPNSTHAVLLGSGMMAKDCIDVNSHTYTEPDASSGVTDYDRDALRPARILTTDAAEALRGLYDQPDGRRYAVDRTYSSGLVNIDVSPATGDPAFRYGWHLDEAALDSLDPSVNHDTRSLFDAFGPMYVKTVNRDGSVTNVRNTLSMVLRKYEDVAARVYAKEGATAVEIRRAALVATLVYGAAHGSSECRRILGKVFMDYTGAYVADSPACSIDDVGLQDLLIEGEFDFLALEVGRHRKVQRDGGDPTIYLGGSFFSGDRRPSGNYEAAGGLARAQAPVTMKADMTPGKTAMFVLDPVQSAVQGSDTDGDTATLIKMLGHGATPMQASLVGRMFDFFKAKSMTIDADGKVHHHIGITGDVAREFFRTFGDNPSYSSLFKVEFDSNGDVKSVEVLPRFGEILGNMMFQVQIDNYRMVEAREFTSAPGVPVRKGTSIADETEGDLYDIGFSGRRPVGPNVVSTDPVPADDLSTRETYRRYVGSELPPGMTYDEAFRACVDAISEKAGVSVKPNLLGSEDASFLSASAADSGDARAVMVSLQATIEHLDGIAAYGDPGVVSLCPALFTRYETDSGDSPFTGDTVYDPCREFVGHLDGISNALFDVVKDLFAPRAGWNRDMLNYLVASLLKDANDEFRARTDGNAPGRPFDMRFNDSWFFSRLVRYAAEYMGGDDSIPGLMKKFNAGNNYRFSEKFGGNESPTMRGMARSALEQGSGTVLRLLAELSRDPYDRKHDNMADSLQEIVDTVDTSFEAKYRKWVRGLSRALSGDAGTKLANMYEAGTLDAGLAEAVRMYAAEHPEYSPAPAAKHFFSGLASALANAGPAMASHVLFGPVREFASRKAAVDRAVEAVDELEALQAANKSISPENAFRASGEKASTAMRQISRSREQIGVDNDIFHVQVFVNSGRLLKQASEFSPKTMSAKIKSSIEHLEDVAGSDSTADSYFRANGMTVPFKSDAELKYAAAALMHADSYLADGTVDSNRSRMGAMLAAVSHGVKLGGKDRFIALVRSFYDGLSSGDGAASDRLANRNNASRRKGAAEKDALDEIFSADVGDIFHGQSGSSVLSRLVKAALERRIPGGAGLFLSRLNITGNTGRISLESKLGPHASTALSDGFHEMLADKTPVAAVLGFEDGPGRLDLMFQAPGGMAELTMSDVAVLTWLRLAATQEFDSVREQDTKVDMTSLFSRSELREMERFGYAAESSLAARALMCVPRSDRNEYDLLRLPGYFDRPPDENWFSGMLRKLSGVELSGVSRYARSAAECKTWLGSLNATQADTWSRAGRGMSGPGRDRYRVSQFSPVNIMAELVTNEEGSFLKVGVPAAAAEEARVRILREHETGTSLNVDTTVVSTFADLVMEADDAVTGIDMLNEDENYSTRADFEFVGKDGDGYPSLEAAVNSYALDALGAYQEVAGPQPEAPDELFRYINGYSGFRAAPETRMADGTYVGNTMSFSAVVGTVIADTRDGVGKRQFGRWLHRTFSRRRLSPVVHPVVREALYDAYRETDEYAVAHPAAPADASPVRAQVSVDLGGDTAATPGSPVTARMTRSGFSVLLSRQPGKNQAVTTFEAIKFALETAFGKYVPGSEKPGVEVRQETVRTEGGAVIPASLVRVTRYIKVDDGGLKLRPVVMYISFGESLDMERDDAFLESLLRAVNDGSAKPMTLEQLKSLSPAQLDRLVDALGANIAGLSQDQKSLNGLGTNALMMLTGLVRLGNGADYVTLFHEYFHQMLGFCRRVGLVSGAEMKELENRFSSDGKFDEEAAAEAFAEYVAGRTRETGAKLARGLSDPDKPGAEDELFDRFFLTAQALLAGTVAFDQTGAPTFMRIIVTGDFSDRRMSKKTQDLTSAQINKIKNVLLSGSAETMDLVGMTELDGVGDVQPASGPVAETEAGIQLAVARMRNGEGTFDGVLAALRADGKANVPGNAPKFEPSAEPFGRRPPEADAGTEARETPAPQSGTPETGAPGPGLREILDAAMEAVRRGDGVTDDERDALEKLYRRVSASEDVSAGEFDLVVGVASRVLRSVCRTLGISYDKWVSEWTNGGFRPELGRLTVKSVTMPATGVTVDYSEAGHSYTSTRDGTTVRYASGTGIVKAFSNDFEKSAAFRNATAEKKTAWRRNSERSSRFGTMIHSVYEDVFNAKGGSVSLRARPSNDRERAAVAEAVRIATMFAENYEFVGAEVIVADPDSMVAGTIDLVLRDRDGNLVIVDHKTSQFIGRKAFDAQHMKGVLSGFEDSTLNHYALQLHIYRELLRRSGMFGVTADTRISLMINHFPGHDDASRDHARETAVRRLEDAQVVKDYEIIADSGAASSLPAGLSGFVAADGLPDMDDAAKRVLAYVASHPSSIPRSGSAADADVPARSGDSALVAELAVRIAHAVVGNSVAKDADGRPVRAESFAPEMYGRMEYLVGRLLGRTSSDMNALAAETDRVARSAMRSLNLAHDDFAARAGNARSGARLGESIDLLEKADRCGDVALRLNRVVQSLIHGDDPARIVPDGEAGAGSDLYDALFRHVFGAVKCVTDKDGTLRYVDAGGALVDVTGRDVQQGIDFGAQAIGLAVAVSRLMKENGVGPIPHGFNPAGAAPAAPADGAPDTRGLKPREQSVPRHLVSLDCTPQMILQSQTSWMASDLMNGFYGTNLRDIMTDSSLQAVTEETNRIANMIEFLMGADVAPGGRPRVVEDGSSTLGKSADGLFEVGEKHRHHMTKWSGTRGYLLGLVTRAARTTGPVFTFDDVNLVNIAGQAIAALVNGDYTLITGYDVSADQMNRIGHLVAAPVSALVSDTEAEGKPALGFYNPLKVMQRVAHSKAGLATGTERPSNLDVLLYRVLTGGLPSGITGCSVDKSGKPTGKVSADGLYSDILSAYRTGVQMVPEKRWRDSALIRKSIVDTMVRKGLAVLSNDGKAVIAVSTDRVDAAWNRRGASGEETTMDKLVAAGRTQSFLDLKYLADIVQTEAHRLNKAVARSGHMQSHVYSPLAGIPDNRLWFETGSGHHGLVVQEYLSAREAFDMAPSSDEVLADKFASFEMALRADHDVAKVRENGVRHTRVRSLERAFDTDDGGRLLYVRGDKLQLLMKLLGLGRRVDDPSEIARFVEAVKNGVYSGDNPDNSSGADLRPDMTVAELDHQMFQLVTMDLLRERLSGGSGKTVFTKPVSEGGFGFGKQDIVDANEVTRRMAARTLLADSGARTVTGTIYGMSETAAFRRYGHLPSAKTGCERIRSMAESIVHAERFRGCLSQMLATVGSGGVPNYIVSPAAGAEQFAPDVFWGALAKFVSTRLKGVVSDIGGFQYDAYRSGVDNMKAVARIMKDFVTLDGKFRNRDAGKTPPFRYHSVPPQTFSGETLFDEVYCLDDSVNDNASVMNQVVGGEAEGYLKQLFGVISSPSIWHGWKIIDRMMSYSKAASVGMSAFFAFATRFESHAAACGMLNAAAGQFKWTSKLLRALDNTRFGKAMSEALRGMGLEGMSAEMPLLSDFMQLANSDDPYFRDMRELCAFAGIPLSTQTRNPMNDAAGHIDNDIRRIKAMLEAGGHHKWAKEVDGVLRAAFVNPGDYAFSNVLNCVQMAVVAQTMYRLKRECAEAERPFDPIFMLRKIAPYLSTEVGGIRAERYAWLTPGMQRVLRMAMFSWQWTMSAWTAGSGEVLTDMFFGGHSTTKATRQYAFIRWMRMLGWVKVGVPVVLQATIRGMAAVIQNLGLVGDPDDPKDKDPLGIEKMPWLCFDNESHVGAFTFDVTPILRLCGRLRRGAAKMIEGTGAEQYVAPAVPMISTVAGGLVGAAATRSVGGGIIGSAIGAVADRLLPDWTGVGHGPNTSGQRRYYMHFGKQSDEFWRWFTDAWSQATSKLSIPVQKVVEAFFGSTNGSAFSKAFHDKPLLDRFFSTESLSPNDNAFVNFCTAFTPFSFASIAQHPDAGVLGMFAPIRMGVSETAAQKRIVARLKKFALDDHAGDPWSNPRNRTNLNLLCADILRDARLNGTRPASVLASALANASTDMYRSLFRALPKVKGDTMDPETVTRALRALYRLNIKRQNIMQSLREKYAQANVDWNDWHGIAARNAIRSFMRKAERNPWMYATDVENHFRTVFEQYDRRRSQQADRGGDGLANFLATDDVPPTLFGVPIVSDGHTEYDLEFFRRNPEAGGFYDMGDEPGDTGPALPEGADGAQ